MTKDQITNKIGLLSYQYGIPAPSKRERATFPFDLTQVRSSDGVQNPGRFLVGQPSQAHTMGMIPCWITSFPPCQGLCGAEWTEVKWNYSGVDNKSGGTTMVSAHALCLDLLLYVWLYISGGQNCCQEYRMSQTSFGHISINSSSILTVSMATESP